MPAVAEKYRHYANCADAFCNQRGNGFIERRSVLQVRKTDRYGREFLDEAGGDALEWTRPLRIARAMGDEDDAFLQ